MKAAYAASAGLAAIAALGSKGAARSWYISEAVLAISPVTFEEPMCAAASVHMEAPSPANIATFNAGCLCDGSSNGYATALMPAPIKAVPAVTRAKSAAPLLICAEVGARCAAHRAPVPTNSTPEFQVCLATSSSMPGTASLFSVLAAVALRTKPEVDLNGAASPP